MSKSKPDIQAEMMASVVAPDGTVRLHGFRYEVFDLPALEGTDDEADHASQIIATAIGKAGDMLRGLARQRLPGSFAAKNHLDELNADLAKMADGLSNAVSFLTDATWWIDHQSELNGPDAYARIVDAGKD